MHVNNIYILFFLVASVVSESVRETETWMPMKTTQTAEVSQHDLVSSGDSLNGSDFGFPDDNEEDDDEGPFYDDDDDEDYNDEDIFSGSGDGVPSVTIKNDKPTDNTMPSSTPNINDNKIPDLDDRPKPTVNEIELVQKNEVPVRAAPQPEEPSNVLMSHAGDESVFNKTEVLAAVITGGAVTLLLAVLLILLLIYRMKKKDEGSYDLGKKPIYKKAPTTEIYA